MGVRCKSTSVSHICTPWILILLDLWLLNACHSQLALVNMDVMENPPSVPVRRQKYCRSHLYTWYHALSSGQRGRVAQRLRFAKSQACPLPRFNLFNTGPGGSAIDISLILKIQLNPLPQHQLNWPIAPGSNLWVSVYNHTLLMYLAYLAMTLQETEVRTEHSFLLTLTLKEQTH